MCHQWKRRWLPLHRHWRFWVRENIPALWSLCNMKGSYLFVLHFHLVFTWWTWGLDFDSLGKKSPHLTCTVSCKSLCLFTNYSWIVRNWKGKYCRKDILAYCKNCAIARRPLCLIRPSIIKVVPCWMNHYLLQGIMLEIYVNWDSMQLRPRWDAE